MVTHKATLAYRACRVFAGAGRGEGLSHWCSQLPSEQSSRFYRASGRPEVLGVFEDVGRCESWRDHFFPAGETIYADILYPLFDLHPTLGLHS